MPRPAPAHVLTWHPRDGFGIRHNHEDRQDAGFGWWGDGLSDAEKERVREYAKLLVVAWTTPDDPAYAGEEVAASWATTDWDDPTWTREAFGQDGDGSGDGYWEIDGEKYAPGHDGEFYRIKSWCSLDGLGEQIPVSESLEGITPEGYDDGPIDVAAITGYEIEEAYVLVTGIARLAEPAAAETPGDVRGPVAVPEPADVPVEGPTLSDVALVLERLHSNRDPNAVAEAERTIHALRRRGILPAAD